MRCAQYSEPNGCEARAAAKLWQSGCMDFTHEYRFRSRGKPWDIINTVFVPQRSFGGQVRGFVPGALKPPRSKLRGKRSGNYPAMYVASCSILLFATQGIISIPSTVANRFAQSCGSGPLGRASLTEVPEEAGNTSTNLTNPLWATSARSLGLLVVIPACPSLSVAALSISVD